MLRFLAMKVVRLVIVLWAVSLITFLMLELLPGDQATAIAATQNPLTLSPDTIEHLRDVLNLDDALPIRYVRWLGDALQGNLGQSYEFSQPVSTIIMQRLPVTLEIGGLAIVLAVLLALPLGLLLAFRENTRLDRVGTGVMFGFLALPEFLLAIFLVYAFAVWLHLFPTSGWTPISEGLVPHLRAIALPVLALTVGQVVVYTRLLRADVIATLQEDYIFAARAKGLSTTHILFRQALRPSLATLMTVVGLQLAAVAGGVVLIETVFALPGVGRLLVDAVRNRDLFLVQGLTLVFAGIFVVTNVLVEVAHGFVDPRVRGVGRAS